MKTTGTHHLQKADVFCLLLELLFSQMDNISCQNISLQLSFLSAGPFNKLKVSNL